MLKYIHKTFLSEYNNWILWLPVFFCAGICGYFSLNYEPDIRYSAYLSAALLAIMVFYRKKQLLLWVLTVFLMISSGFAAANFRSIMQYSPMLNESPGAVGVKGRVLEVKQHGGGKRFILTDLRIRKVSKENTPKKIRINVRTAHNGAKEGDIVSVFAHLSPPPKAVIPGGYDFAQYAYFDQIGAVGYALTEIRILEESRTDNIADFIQSVRHSIGDKIMSHMDKENGNVATALIIGERGGINRETLSNIREAGIAHILAISGLHLSLVAALFFFTTRLILVLIPSFALHYNIKKWAALVAIFGSLGYLLISGAPISAQRAFIMTTLILLAVMIDRTGTPMRSVALAAMVVMITTPEAVLTPSFQMSFSAVIALISFYDLSRKSFEGFKDWSVLQKIMVYFLSVIASSLVAGIATAPFSIYHFNNLSTYGAISNLLAIPITSFWVMPAGVLSVIFMPLSLEGVFLEIMSVGISTLLNSAEYISDLPAASSVVKATTPAALGLIVFGGLWLCLWKRKWRIFGVMPIILGIIIAKMAITPDILIEGKSGLFALKAENGQWVVSSKRKGRYTRQRWLGRMGAGSYASTKEYKGDDIKCDDFGCIYEKGGQKIMIAQHPASMLDNCDDVDMMINLSYLSVPCKKNAEKVIDMQQIVKKGTHAIYISDENINVQNTVDSIGDRPWNY